MNLMILQRGMIKMKKYVILIISLFLLSGCNSTTKTSDIDVSSISHDEVITCDEKDAILESDPEARLIDVRTEEEYKESHLDNAINISIDDIENIQDISSIKSDSPIIVYCASGNRSARAVKELKNLGYTNVYDLGGISNCKS